jgi:maltose alpha-D-glucosyltransferase/alpha-amylase
VRIETPLPEFLTLVLPEGWASLGEPATARTLAQRILPEFLKGRRWFAAKDRTLASVALEADAVVAEDGPGFLIARVRVAFDSGDEHLYQVPLSIAWETARDDPLGRLHAAALARVRMGRRVGVLYDALAEPPFPAMLLAAIRSDLELECDNGVRLRCLRSPALADADVEPEPEIRRLGGEQSNTSLKIGETMILKVYRRLQPGIHPEVEMGRFLTDVAGYANTPPLLGAVERIGADGTPAALAVLHGFVRNQGDGWTFTLDYLDRFLSRCEMMPAGGEPEGEEADDPHAYFLVLMRRLGRRIGELHRALARGTDDPAFRPERAFAEDLTLLSRKVHAEAEAARAALVATLATATPTPTEATRIAITALVDTWPAVDAAIDRLAPAGLDVCKGRIHGDLHLGQVVVVQDDFFVLDFEGEPSRALADRRVKQSPLRDVAGVVRSFEYAGRAALRQRTPVAALARHLQAAVQDWERRSVAAFLEGYGDTAAGCPTVPAEAEAFDRVLGLFVLEKALYEIGYEAANRPDWIDIPIASVQRLIAAA